MSTAKRRRGHSLHLDLSDGQKDDLPPIAAAFLAIFDARAGQTIAWQRSVPGLELESLEFKSLPSGLHNVTRDLIYFTHYEHTGISAFVNNPSEHSDRNAVMLAVGVLVPSHGLLGKSWKHAEGLKELASTLANDPENTHPLEQFWQAHHPRESEVEDEQAFSTDSPTVDKVKRTRAQSSPNGNAKKRSRLSIASGLAPPGQSLSSHHPALSLRSSILDTFGPLIFPLYKAALLRKRILLIGHGPVELACNFVWIISILSGIPSSLFELIPLEPLPTHLRPLFSVGVHDITRMSHGGRSSNRDQGYGWIACTTDSILSEKHLFDCLVHVPLPYNNQAKQKVWPRILDAKGNEIKATQRDVRRFITLRREVQYFNDRHSPRTTPGELSLSVTSLKQDHDTEASSALEANLSESLSWPALFLKGLWWWASAGEKGTGLDEEEEFDAALLRPIDGYGDGSPSRPRSARKSLGMSLGVERDIDKGVGLEFTLVAYFHRLTTLILKSLSDIIEDADNDSQASINGAPSGEGAELREAERLLPEQEEERRRVIVVHMDGLSRLTDPWSESDRAFVKELIAFYWGREADVRGRSIDCCGIRIC